jgi:hypothetical protein
VDAGIITKDRKLKQMINSQRTDDAIGIIAPYNDYDIHASAGLGLKLVMNHNFIISVEYGKPFDKRDGNGGLNIGTNYIF